MTRAILTLALLALATAAQAQTTTIRADRLAALQRIVVGTGTFGSTSPIQISGLPSGLTPAGAVIVDSSGNFGSSTDYPRKSVAETVTGNWVFTGNIDFRSNLADSTGNLTLNDAVDVVGALSVTASTGLPAQVSANLVHAGGFSSPVSGRTYIGDATGWEWLLSSRISSTTTDRISFTDTGTIRPAANYSGALGQDSRKWAELWSAELKVETLVAQDTIATIGGRILVGKTSVLTAELPYTSGYLYIKHNAPAVDDVLYLEGGGQVEFVSIATYVGACPASCPAGVTGYAYTINRNLDGTGANDWQAGDAIFNTRQTGAGFIDLYSDRGVKASTEVGPTIVGNVRSSLTYNNWSPRWAIGNLRGLYGYGTSTDVYGFAAGSPAGTYVTADATNGFRICYTNCTAPKVTIDTSGNATFGPTNDKHVAITSGVFEIKDGTNARVKIDGDQVWFGKPGDVTVAGLRFCLNDITGAPQCNAGDATLYGGQLLFRSTSSSYVYGRMEFSSSEFKIGANGRIVIGNPANLSPVSELVLQTAGGLYNVGVTKLYTDSDLGWFFMADETNVTDTVSWRSFKPSDTDLTLGTSTYKWRNHAFDSTRGHYRRASTLSVGTAAWTAITWDSDDKEQDTTDNESTGAIDVAEAGYYAILVQTRWDASATGIRGIQISRGTTIIAQCVIPANATSNLNQCGAQDEWSAGDDLKVEAYQNSGGNLNLINATDGLGTWVKIVKVL